MAWISVHESIVGPKLRNLCRRLGCSQWEAEGILVSLWFWGLANAEKDGFIPYAGKEDVARCLYSSATGSDLDPKDIVNALTATGWIDETDKGIFIHDWDTWQEQWYKAKERRESDARRKRESRRKAEAELPDAKKKDNPPEPPAERPADSPQTQTNGEVPQKPPEPPKQSEEPEEPRYTPAFEEFWEAYPRKSGKGEAYKKYHARRNDGFSDAELLIAAKNYATQCKRLKTDKQYIKHPKTFLSDSTPFTDYIPKSKPEERADRPSSGGNPFAEYEGE